MGDRVGERAPAGQAAVEAALRAAEARYRDVFDNAATGIVHVRADGSFLEVNPAWAAVLGYETPAQYVAEVGNARRVWADPAERDVFVRAVAEQGSVHGFEARLLRRDGSVAWIALDARAVRGEAGEVVELHTSGLDVTARKVAEQALRESEARFRSIFVHSLDGILLTSADGRVISANPAACQILDRSEEQLQALDRAALVENGIDPFPAAGAAGAARPAGAAAYAEVRMLRPDGAGFPAEITCSAFADADGVRNISMIIRDVSERHRVEEELRAAKQAADEASQAKSEFLSRMSHELRTPLNAVLGFAQLLELDVEDGHRQSVQQIRRAGAHLLNLIDEVLDISRIEAGELALSAEPVLVAQLVAEAVDLIRPFASRAGVVIVTVPGHALHHHVRADRQRMRQVMLNLLSNAVKYNHAGGAVTVRSWACDDGVLRIAVQDTGVGLSPEDQARLFTPFERLGAAGSEIEGTGVGLAVSQRLAHAMCGRISVDSAPGRGSTFTLELPLLDGTGVDVRPAAAGSAPDAPAPAADPEPVSLLCIEDNPANVRLLEAIVRRRPRWRLTHAGQGQLGLELAAGDPPDLVLLDLHLPDMPGIQVLQRLKACPATAAVPVVVVSADATPGQVERLKAAGAECYLTKPIDVAELLGLLDAPGTARR